MSRRAVKTVLALLVLTVALVPLANTPEPGEGLPRQEIGEEISGDPTLPEGQVTATTALVRPATKKPVRSPGQSENIRQASQGPLSEDQRDLEESVARVLESALRNNRQDVILIADIRRKCSGPFYTPESVLSILDRIQESGFSENVLYATGRGGHARFETFEAYEQFLWQRLEECTAINPLFGDELRRDVLALAESGLASARYLYAMWPSEYGPMAYQASLERVEYQERAMAFTRLNMMEREPLGLLALGQSYVGGGHRSSLFTPHDFALGRTLLLASRKCGIEFPWLSEQLARILRTTRRVSDERLEVLETASDSLRMDYCL